MAQLLSKTAIKITTAWVHATRVTKRTAVGQGA
jgi:hypothetical protein